MKYSGKITAYVHGSVLQHHNTALPRYCGWAYKLITEEGLTEINSGYYESKTNNQTEIISAIHALQNIEDKSAEVIILSDLNYLVDIINTGIIRDPEFKDIIIAELKKFSKPVCAHWIEKGSDAHILEVEQLAEQASEAIKP